AVAGALPAPAARSQSGDAAIHARLPDALCPAATGAALAAQHRHEMGQWRNARQTALHRRGAGPSRRPAGHRQGIISSSRLTQESVMTSNRTAGLMIAWLGLAGLASAMGIGRFAFTPALPLMQTTDGLTLVQGGWLASVNYAGYLVGALLCIWLPTRPAFWARAGLLVVALVTLAMTVGDHFSLWLLWRFVAGCASAFVLVGLSAWCLGRLTQLGQPQLAGLIYAG